MKHRNPILILLAALFLMMSACAAPPPPAAAKPEPTASSAPEPEQSPEPVSSHKSPTELTDAMSAFPEISAERTAAMSSWGEYGFGIVDGDTYYGRFFLKGDSAPMLFSLELKSGNRNVSLESHRILDSEHSPKYLIKQGNTLYYVMLDRETGGSCGIATVGTDGSGRKVLYEGVCDSLSAAGGRLFFTDVEGRPVSINEKGGDLRILTDRKVFYLFAADEDWLIFQDDRDKESLHLFRISDGVDIRLTGGPAFSPVIRGTSLFFSVPDKENSPVFRLARIDLRSYGERYDEEEQCFVPVFDVQLGDRTFGGEFYIFGDTICAMNGTAPTAIENWKDLEDNAFLGYSRAVRFISDRWAVEELFGKDGGITALMFHDRSGGHADIIPWLN